MSDWTEAVQQHLAEMVTCPMSAQEIADALNAKFGTKFSRRAVLGRCYRTKLELPLELGGQSRDPNKQRTRRVRPRRYVMGAPRLKIIPPKPVVPAPLAHPCSLMALKNESCRYAYGDPKADDFFFCGAPEADFANDIPYCQFHMALTHTTNREAVAETHADVERTAVLTFESSRHQLEIPDIADPFPAEEDIFAEAVA